jgi:hypothetical protein
LLNDCGNNMHMAEKRWSHAKAPPLVCHSFHPFAVGPRKGPNAFKQRLSSLLQQMHKAAMSLWNYPASTFTNRHIPEITTATQPLKAALTSQTH